MEIPPFPRKLENLDPENLFKARLSETIVHWPEQAIPLIGYMGWPNDLAARDKALGGDSICLRLSNERTNVRM